MKICRVYPNLQTDLWYAEHYIAKELYKKGHTTTFITSSKYPEFWKPYLKNKEGIGYFKYDYFEIFRIKSIFPLEKTIFTNWIKLYNLIYVKNKFDVLHLSSVGSFTTLIVLFLDKFNWKNSPQIFISDHTDTRTHKRNGIFAKLYHLFFRLLFNLLGKRVSKIITFDTVGIDVLSKRLNISRKRFEIIPLGYDQDLFCYLPEKRNTIHKFIVGYAGKIDPKKRIEVLFDGIASSTNKAEIKVIIVGFKENDDYCNMLVKRSIELNLDVEFRPFADKNGLAKFYQFVNVAVFPGGVSITTIEANGCGTPIILYESIQGLSSRVENGRGVIFNTLSELINAIDIYYEKYVSNKINYKEISKATAQTSSWNDISDKYYTLYKKK